jgi:hypothetical protein
MIQQVERRTLEKKKKGLQELCGQYQTVLFDTNSVYAPFQADLYHLTTSPIKTGELLKLSEVLSNFRSAVESLGNLTTISEVCAELNRGMRIVGTKLHYLSNHPEQMRLEHPYAIDTMKCVINEYELLIGKIMEKKSVNDKNGDNIRIAKSLSRIVRLAKYPDGNPSPSETDYRLVGALFSQLMKGKRATLISNDRDISGTIMTGAAAMDFCGLAPAGGSFEQTMQDCPIKHHVSKKGGIGRPDLIQRPEAGVTFEPSDKKSIEECIASMYAIK